jgi:hypothetical protein
MYYDFLSDMGRMVAIDAMLNGADLHGRRWPDYLQA